MKLDTRVFVNRPVGEVFARWADLERAPEWAATVIERRKLTEGPVGVGSKYRAVDQFPGRRIEFTLEITAYEPDRFMAGTWSGAVKGGWEARFDERDGGTELTVHAEMKPSGMLMLLSPLMGGVVFVRGVAVNNFERRAMEKNLVRFKVWVEGGGS